MAQFGISIAKNSNASEIILSDISKEALKVCYENIILNDATNKCRCICSDLFSNVNMCDVDMLVSNPPYIKSEVIESLDESVKKEPLIALDGGKDGLAIYRRLLDGAMHKLRNGAPILLEIGYDQRQDLLELISKYECYEYIECIKDIEGRDRVIVCRFHQI